ncbi:hypothetical protein LCGC14_1945770 [marine sediment metagenome]|uniref:Phage terminase large subunit N-terminal domain-containing protein n=1 Tax=marine sediment metagenome TaxID=412755 RepID=A0A0F9HX98_9ZZZZ
MSLPVTKHTDIHYHMEPTPGKMHKSGAFYRGILGCVRSGKSSACCWELWRRAREQAPQKDGIRRTRFAIVRNTYRELEDTTLKTWLDWFPENAMGPFNKQTMTHRIRRGDVDTEILFRALDRPGDIGKLLSLEVTGGWVNEAREVPKAIIDTLGDRVGQYPAKKDGGCTWFGVLMDTNPPDDDHWWYKLAEENTPDNWEFFRQPGGLIEKDGKFVVNPKAENIHNLNEGHDYYLTRKGGKSDDYIRVYYCGQYGFVIEGKPVIPEYVDAVHCMDIDPVRGQMIYIGLDFGLTPCAVFTQKAVNGQWLWLDELCAEDMGIVRFAEILKPKIRKDFKDFEIEIWGDPAGDQRSPTDKKERTTFQILKANGIEAKPAPPLNNDFTIRREAIATPLTRLIDGRPGMIVSPKCKTARKGLAGGYHYKRTKVTGEEIYQDHPVKNVTSHPVEAGGYAMLGAGEGSELIKSFNIDYKAIQPGAGPRIPANHPW